MVWPLISTERHLKILEIISKNGFVEVSSLAEALGVSAPTIRKDLTQLEAEGKLIRIHGGAKLPDRHTNYELSFGTREDLLRGIKAEIGKKIAEIIQDGDTLFFDASTTVWSALPYLERKKDLTIVSNVAGQILVEISRYQDISFISSGGALRHSISTFTGPIAEETIRKLYVDKAFISPPGLSLAKGLTDSHLLEAQVRAAMISSARRVYLCVDHSKFNFERFVSIAPLREIDYVITDSPVLPEYERFFDENGIEVILVNA